MEMVTDTYWSLATALGETRGAADGSGDRRSGSFLHCSSQTARPLPPVPLPFFPEARFITVAFR